jgi:hypothetical protein
MCSSSLSDVCGNVNAKAWSPDNAGERTAKTIDVPAALHRPAVRRPLYPPFGISSL